VLDARTGKSIEHDIVAVTVLNDNSTMADAWSSTLLYLSRQAGRCVADRLGISALLIIDNNG
jgi:FAD:protein FMN transferase